MIGEFLLDIIFGIVTAILDAFNFENAAFSFDVVLIGWIWDFVDAILYFLPVDTCITIVGIICSFALFRAVIRLIITIWDLLPIA